MGLGATAAAVAAGIATGTALADESVWDEEYDIVIAGAGGAGLIAAIQASNDDPEASILIVEKQGYAGGNSIMSGGNIGAIFTDVQAAAAADNPFFADDTLEMYYEDKMSSGDYQSDPELVRLFVDNAYDNYLWLTDLGITWTRMGIYEQPAFIPSDPAHAAVQGASVYLQSYDDEGCYKGINQKGRWVCGSTYKELSGGPANIACLLDQVTENYPNVTIVYNTPLTGIVREGQVAGDVLGVTVQSDGAEKAIRATRAVVLTTGGFAGNGEMLHMYNGKIDPNVVTSGSPANTGDGLVAAAFVGAQTVNMGSIQIDHQFAVNSSALINSAKSANPFGGPGLYINVGNDGKRFWPEMPGAAQYSDARLTQLNKKGLVHWWTLGDANGVAANELTDEDIEAFANGVGFVCETLDEVAEVIGCPVADLQATLDTYNGYVETGIDEEYGKSARFLTQKIDTAPYYVYESCYTCRSTPGGLRIAPDAAVLDLKGQPIPHLYAAGEVTGNLHGKYRNTGGDSWTDIACFGRIAGSSAVAAK